MDWVEQTLTKVNSLWERSLDRHVRVAVTGLSGTGKTAFITSLMNQLLTCSSNNSLPFFSAVTDHQIKAVKLATHDDLHIPSFKYQNNINQLTDIKPKWPASTTSISQAQIKCRYKVHNKWLKRVQEDSYLTIDIVDYPGEWLLDLPLLQLSYKQWSKLCIDYLNSQRRKSYTENVSSKIENLEYHRDLDDEGKESLATLSKEYKAVLIDYRETETDYSLALPGRFILPGELTGAPVLEFLPILNEDTLNLDWTNFSEDSLLRELERRYDYYRDKVIKPFFDEYFSKVDRQILLVDTTKVLESGYESYQDLKGTIEQLLTGFSYGRSNWLKRLFSPSIDKLMIATTKSDLVPPDQHAALEAFMQKMVAQAKNDVDYEGIDVETMAISSIATSEPVATEHNGQKLLCVKGLDFETRESVIHYPGKVPAQSLSRTDWQDLEISFTPLAIPRLQPDESLPHIRMDKVLQFLIGDKFS